MNRTCQQAKCQNSRSLRYRSTAHRPPSKYQQPSKISGYRRDISFDIYLLNVVYLWVKQKRAAATNPTTGVRRPRPTNTYLCRRRPTLPHPPECSTIGAGGLSFRVRNGTGRDPTANTTDKNQATNQPHHVGWVVSCQTLNSRREQKPLFNHYFVC